MEIYTGFAKAYDTFMDNIPYKEWVEFIKRKLSQYGIEDGIMLDLGCGTGTLTGLLSDEGYDMIGVDSSIEMLDIAKEKLGDRQDILFLCQDMREFELYGTVKAIVCVCDSINYILEKEELREVFKLVNNYLDPDGIFLFDFRTPFSYEEIGSETIAENREEMSFIWDNYYYEEEKVNEYELSLFIREDGNLFQKYTETHYQRAYSLEEMREVIEDSGLLFLEASEDYTDENVSEKSRRIVVLAQESGKNKMKKFLNESERIGENHE